MGNERKCEKQRGDISPYGLIIESSFLLMSIVFISFQPLLLMPSGDLSKTLSAFLRLTHCCFGLLRLGVVRVEPVYVHLDCGASHASRYVELAIRNQARMQRVLIVPRKK